MDALLFEVVLDVRFMWAMLLADLHLIQWSTNMTVQAASLDGLVYGFENFATIPI